MREAEIGVPNGAADWYYVLRNSESRNLTFTLVLLRQYHSSVLHIKYASPTQANLVWGCVRQDGGTQQPLPPAGSFMIQIPGLHLQTNCISESPHPDTCSDREFTHGSGTYFVHSCPRFK